MIEISVSANNDNSSVQTYVKSSHTFKATFRMTSVMKLHDTNVAHLINLITQMLKDID